MHPGHLPRVFSVLARGYRRAVAVAGLLLTLLGATPGTALHLGTATASAPGTRGWHGPLSVVRSAVPAAPSMVVRGFSLSPVTAAAVSSPPGWQRLTYGGAVMGGAGRLPARIPSYRLAIPPHWSARLWPDTLAAYGQLNLWSPTGSTVQLAILPIRPGGPTPVGLIAHDRAALLQPVEDSVALPIGRALRLSGVAIPRTAGWVIGFLYVQRDGLVYRFMSAGPAGSTVGSALLQIAATLRLPVRGPVRTMIPPPPPPQPSAERCCHCPAWGAQWGAVLTSLDGVPVYWNAGDVDNGCVGTYGYLYQCVELVQRYFALRWDYPAIWRGVAAAADMRYEHPDGIQFVPNGGSPGPREGDALLFYGGDVGHVALVRGVDRQTGLLTVVEENWSPTGEATLSIYADNMVAIRDSAYGSYAIAGWLHSPLNKP